MIRFLTGTSLVCRPKRLRLALLFLTGLAFFVWMLSTPRMPAQAEKATGPSTSNQTGHKKFFDDQVLPILKEHCYDCHSHESGEAAGGLVLDSKNGWKIGGNTGPALVPGQPAKSLLITAIEYHDKNLQMPPDDDKMSAKKIAVLRKWVADGAFDPRQGKAPAAKTAGDHWAFQPVARPKIPIVHHKSWPKNSIDHFILARLEKENLRPAEDENPHTLLRRLTFDLTGLPPTPAQMESFLHDSSPQAYEKVVDRLLASPAFGERWARHWLDIVRYADSNGGGVNVVHDDAWRYRDWVIESYNRDKPYHEFLQEQIAGDLMPSTSNHQKAKQIIATGMLMLGSKPLAKYDKVELKLDVADEQLDTIGRAFLGLTVGCARCHDHKFDPISMRDYYGLAGIFMSTRSTGFNGKGGPLSYLNTVKLPIKPANTPWKGYMGKRPPTALAVHDYTKPHDEAIRRRGLSHAKGPVVPRGVITTLGDHVDIPKNQSGRLELARWIASENHPLPARVYVNRVWKHLFSEGLVSSEDNFGTSGRPPTHPALLDHLATRFMQENWSTKKLVRQLVLSHTYRLCSSPTTVNYVEKDPDNHLYWKASIRRLDAEALRDAMLAVSGRLDRSRGGPVVPWTGRLVAGQKRKKVKLTLSLHRRAIYLPIIRDGMAMIDSMDMFSTFDFADPSMVVGDRQPTTVPAQALFLLNSPLVAKLCTVSAKQVLQTHQKAGQRVHQLYLATVNRPPTKSEITSAITYVEQFQQRATKIGKNKVEREEQAWASLCQCLFACNEFLFVR